MNVNNKVIKQQRVCYVNQFTNIIFIIYNVVASWQQHFKKQFRMGLFPTLRENSVLFKSYFFLFNCYCYSSKGENNKSAFCNRNLIP